MKIPGKKFTEDMLRVRAHSTTLAALQAASPDLLKALKAKDIDAFSNTIEAMMEACFMSAVIGTIYLQEEIGMDFSPIKDSESYKISKERFGKDPGFSE